MHVGFWHKECQTWKGKPNTNNIKHEPKKNYGDNVKGQPCLLPT